MEAYAYLLGSPDLVVDARAVGIDVEMVGSSGTTGQNQFGERHERADVDGLGSQPRPDGVERLEPAKQAGVLRRGHRAGQGLVEMMVGVHQPRQHDHPAGVDDPIGLGGQFGCGPDLFDDIVTHE